MDGGVGDLLCKGVLQVDPAVKDPREVLAVHQDQLVLVGEAVELDDFRSESGHGDEQTSSGEHTPIDLSFQQYEIGFDGWGLPPPQAIAELRRRRSV
jgi:hypothetical protein